MLTALWTASTGMEAQMTNLDVIANNLANVNTVGFKKSRADFQDLLYQTLASAGESTGPDSMDPVGEQIGVGTKLASITKEFSIGSLERTDRDLDVAIAGKGMLVLQGPDGNDVYTRDGTLKLDGTGRIVNSDGYPLVGVGTVPENARGINFGPTGEVAYLDENNQENTIGQIQLAMFVNPSGLNAKGGNLYAETPASGAASLVTPGLESSGMIQQYFVEKSNVSIVEEMVNMISAQRAYEINSKMIRAGDEMLSTANQIS
ncbi:MAG: flagellar basal-body rod protein FlgG [Waddliaceae bacterium]|nr:flagellar basal-body rod protein FlgG [Waddliaceae bacterium]